MSELELLEGLGDQGRIISGGGALAHRDLGAQVIGVLP
jgi:hypothetical protein